VPSVDEVQRRAAWQALLAVDRVDPVALAARRVDRPPLGPPAADQDSRRSARKLRPHSLLDVAVDGPCRDRTYDLEIKSLLLYQLS
jgi:hypothetical protein